LSRRAAVRHARAVPRSARECPMPRTVCVRDTTVGFSYMSVY